MCRELMDDYVCCYLCPHCFLNSILTTSGLISDNILSHVDIVTHAVSSLSLSLNISLHPSSPVVQLVAVCIIRFKGVPILYSRDRDGLFHLCFPIQW